MKYLEIENYKRIIIRQVVNMQPQHPTLGDRQLTSTHLDDKVLTRILHASTSKGGYFTSKKANVMHTPNDNKLVKQNSQQL